MEDQKLRTPYDSINTRKGSWSKEISEIRSILQELVGKVATVRPQTEFTRNENRDPSPASPMFRHKYASIKFERFCGDNPEAWIFQAEHYFEFYETAENYKLSLASLYLDGEALEWYQWLFRNKQLADWKHFTAKVMIRFRKQHLESQRCHLANSQPITSVIDYQSRFEDVSSEYGELDVLASGITSVYLQWNGITNSPLLQCCYEQSEGNNKINAPKVFDDLSERSKDANSIDISCKRSQLEVKDPHKVCKLIIGDTTEAYFPNDLVNSVSTIAEVNGRGDDVKNESKNDEEEIVTIRDEPIEFVISNADKPSLRINSIVSIFCDLSVFKIHEALDDRWNQLFARHFREVYPFGLAQRWEEMPFIPSTCSSAKPISRGILDNFGLIEHVAVILNLHQVCSKQFELDFPFDPGSSLCTTFFGAVRNCVFWDALGSYNPYRFMTLTMCNSWIAPLELWFRNTNIVRECAFFTVTNDGRDYVGCFIILSLDMLPELAECHGYDLKCLVSQSNLVGKGILLHEWDPGIHRQLVKLNHLNSGILIHTQSRDVLVNAKQLKRLVCVLTVHQRESFLVGGGIEKWVVRRWNSQKLDHQQLFEIIRPEHEPVLSTWPTDRGGKYRWVEDLDGNNAIKCNVCHILVHQEFHGVNNVQNLVSWFYPACEKLEFERDYCFYLTPCGILMASANAFLWAYVTCVWSQLEATYQNVDTIEPALGILSVPCNNCPKVCVICKHLQGSGNLGSKCTTNFRVLFALQAGYHMDLIEFGSWLNHISQYFSALTKNEMAATLALGFLPVRVDVSPPHIVIFSDAGVDENVTFDIALVNWLLLYSLQRFDQEDKEDTILVQAALNIYPSLNKFAVVISILFYPNLEDKVLIQDGSIVVNQVDFVRAYVLEGVNGTDLFESIGPSKILESLIWDPDPIINWLNRTSD